MKSHTPKRSHLIFIGIMLVVIASFTSAYIYYSLSKEKSAVYHQREVKIKGVYLTESKEIGDFQLLDHKGNSFSKDDLTGQWTMMFFGFTNCGYVCPTIMSELNQMYKILKTDLLETQLPKIVFVTVDPERDSISRLNEYINAYNQDFVAARASLSETEALEKQLHVVAVKTKAEDDEDDEYTVNHSSEIILFNPSGKVQAYLSFPPKADRLVHDYKMILSNTIS